jgi:hypothetical protein
MKEIVEFEGLKLKTSFNFKNKLERNNYFTKALLRSISEYREKQKEYFSEKVYVAFSYSIIFKYLAFIFLGIGIFIPIIRLPIVLFSIGIFFISLAYHSKFKYNILSYKLIIEMCENDEIMNMMRDSLLESEEYLKNNERR